MVMSDNKISTTKNEKNSFKNVSSELDARFALRIIRWLFSLLGIWPLAQESSVIERISAVTLMTVCAFLLGFIFIPGLFLLIKMEDLATKVRLTGPLSYCLMAIIMYYSLASAQPKLRNCIEQIDTNWRELKSMHDKNIMIDRAKYGRLGTIICACLIYNAGIFYALLLPQISGNLNSLNNETIRSFAFPSYYGFFDPQESPAYEIIFTVHYLCLIVMDSIHCASFGLAVVFVMHACGQLEIIIGWLKDLVDGAKDDEDSNRRFNEIIQHHDETLRFIDNIEKIISGNCLVEIMGCTFGICSLGYDLMLQWGQSDVIGIMTYLTRLVSYVFNIFTYCYIGEFLTEKCKKVGETAYMIEWYRLPERKALGLRLIIVRAQNPFIITAGKLVDLSLHNFSNVIRSSIAYLNLLRHFME